MRTDAIIDKRQVRLPNASTLGFGKWKAQVGDLVVFRETETKLSHGRMIGRVHYATSYDGRPPIKDYLLVIVLNETLDHTYERWVDPETVERCYTQTEYTDRRKLVEYFLSDELTESPIEEIRRSTEYGASTVYKYRKDMKQRADEQADFEERHKDCKVTPCAFCVRFASEVIA